MYSYLVFGSCPLMCLCVFQWVSQCPFLLCKRPLESFTFLSVHSNIQLFRLFSNYDFGLFHILFPFTRTLAHLMFLFFHLSHMWKLASFYFICSLLIFFYFVFYHTHLYIYSLSNIRFHLWIIVPSNSIYLALFILCWKCTSIFSLSFSHFYCYINFYSFILYVKHLTL